MIPLLLGCHPTTGTEEGPCTPDFTFDSTDVPDVTCPITYATTPLLALRGGTLSVRGGGAEVTLNWDFDGEARSALLVPASPAARRAAPTPDWRLALLSALVPPAYATCAGPPALSAPYRVMSGEEWLGETDDVSFYLEADGDGDVRAGVRMTVVAEAGETPFDPPIGSEPVSAVAECDDWGR